jgi:hypothetical protein
MALKIGLTSPSICLAELANSAEKGGIITLILILKNSDGVRKKIKLSLRLIKSITHVYL